jgi:hypothetical protein
MHRSIDPIDRQVYWHLIGYTRGPPHGVWCGHVDERKNPSCASYPIKSSRVFQLTFDFFFPLGGGASPILAGGAIWQANSVDDRGLAKDPAFVVGQLLRGTMVVYAAKVFEAIAEEHR